MIGNNDGNYFVSTSTKETKKNIQLTLQPWIWVMTGIKLFNEIEQQNNTKNAIIMK